MEAIVEYIITNSTWFIGGIIIVLLAVIGWYADKTNFGQGKQNTEYNKGENVNSVNNINNNVDKPITHQTVSNDAPKTDDSKLFGVIDEMFTENNSVNAIGNNINSNTSGDITTDLYGDGLLTNFSSNDMDLKNTLSTQENAKIIDNFSNIDVNNYVQNTSNQEFQSDVDKNYEILNEEFDEVLPKKDIINHDLLGEIDSLTFDKTQKLDLNDIPDLDDVELPEIKKLKPEEDDIWKF